MHKPFANTPTIQFLFADLTPAGDEDWHRHTYVTVWKDGQRHQVLHQHTTGGWQHCEGTSVCCMSSSAVCSVIISQYVFPSEQFLHGRGHRQVNTKTIQSVSVGQKDQNKGLFHLWQEIFQLHRTKRYSMSWVCHELFFCIWWLLRPFSETAIFIRGSQSSSLVKTF